RVCRGSAGRYATRRTRICGRNGSSVRPQSKNKILSSMPLEGRNFARIGAYGRVSRMVRGLTHLSHICHPHRPPVRTSFDVPARATRRRRTRVPSNVLTAALLCATLGGCAGGIESMYSSGFWAQPGKYDFIKCPEIARRIEGASGTEKNLVNLM